MIAGLLSRFDKMYFVRFAIIFLGLHFFHLFYYGVTVPGGSLYSSFLQQHLNYIEWVKNMILYNSNLITRFFGFTTYIEDHLSLKVFGGSGVSLNFACLGLDLCSFWFAFIVAHQIVWWKRVYWSLLGIVLIGFINCCRIALLLISMERGWKEPSFIDHHDLFNLACYALIFLLLYLFIQTGENEQPERLSIPETQG